MNLNDLKETIKQSSIVQIIGSYIPLNKKGANWEAVCPFHDDHNPSLKVSDSKNLYKCFVCGAAGDSIKFVQDLKNLEFLEALEEISSLLGLNFEQYQKSTKLDPKLQMAYRVLNYSEKIYYQLARSGTSQEIFKHFIKTRGLKQESVEIFRLGFAPEGNQLLNFLQQNIADPKIQNEALSVAKEIALIKTGKHGDYDSFRKRIIFPIWNQRGQVIGFGSRSTQKDQMPKYLNSSESSTFKKRSILYPFHLAKPRIRESQEVILVEGYMDAISLYQAGFQNTLAIMGIALSEESAKFLESQVKKVYLCLDNDSAGDKASVGINKTFLSLGIIPYAVDLSPDKDPDDFIKNHGALEFQKRLETAIPFIDQKILGIIPNPIPDNYEAKLSCLQEVMDLLSPLGERLEANERILSCAQKLNLKSDAQSLIGVYSQQIRELKASSPQGIQAPGPSLLESEVFKQTEFSSSQAIIEKGPEILSELDQYILKQILILPDILENVRSVEILDLIGDHGVKSLVLWLKRTYPEIDEAQYHSMMMDYLHSTPLSLELSHLVSRVFYDFRPVIFTKESINEHIDGLIKNCKKIQLRHQRKVLIEKQKTCAEEEQAMSYLKEIKEIDTQLANL